MPWHSTEFASCSHWMREVKPPWHKLFMFLSKIQHLSFHLPLSKKDKPHISQTNLIPTSIYVSKRFPWQYIKLKEESFRKKHISNVIPHLGLCLNYIYFILTFCPGSSGKFFFFSIKKKNPHFFLWRQPNQQSFSFSLPVLSNSEHRGFYLIPFLS